MNTIEISYVMGITLLVISSLIIGSIRLHERVTDASQAQFRIEADSHRKNGEKIYKPEELMRQITLLQGLGENEDK